MIKYLFLFLATISLISCNNDDDATPLLDVASERVTNLHAPQSGGQGQPISGDFTKFDFSTGQSTTSATDWDIAFRGTSIIINGGASTGSDGEPDRTGNAAVYITSGGLAAIGEVDTQLFVQDTATGYAIASGSGNGWYTYSGPPNHLIEPITGGVLVVRTRDGKYAKLAIESYYKDMDPSNPANGRYYTFDYVHQPNNGVETF